MNPNPEKLGLLRRVRKLEIGSSRRDLARRSVELASAARAREAAECREAASAAAEAASLARRNADPGDPAALLHSRASAHRAQQAAEALRTCRSGEAHAAGAMDLARRQLLRAEARHDAVCAQLRAELAGLRRRAERRREDDRAPGIARAEGLNR